MGKTIPEEADEYDETHVIERPDGFYWRDALTGKECGPFRTLLEAIEDMGFDDDADPATSDDLHQAEDELGIADWIDPDTGRLAESPSRHFEDH